MVFTIKSNDICTQTHLQGSCFGASLPLLAEPVTPEEINPATHGGTLDIQEPFNGPKEPLAIQPGHGMPWQALHFLNHPMLENHGDSLTSHVPLPHEFIRK